jgi:hypothetical protein
MKGIHRRKRDMRLHVSLTGVAYCEDSMYSTVFWAMVFTTCSN